MRSIKHTRAKVRKIRSTDGGEGKVIFWIKLLACIVKRRQEGTREASIGREGGKEKRKEREGGRGSGSNVRIQERVLLVGYKRRTPILCSLFGA